MRFLPTEFAGLKIIELQSNNDQRGTFTRIYCKRELAESGILSTFVQDSVSINDQKNTIRGMHWQKEPYSEDKFICCFTGAIFDVVVDLRADSPTYLNWFGLELTAKNQKALFIPKGFAHGYQTLEENTTVYYKMSQFYDPKSGRGLRFDDPKIHIQWKNLNIPFILSEQDKNWEYL